jgi:hypothetical protein
MAASNGTRVRKRANSKAVAAKPGDWVIHAAGKPRKVYAVGSSLKDLERQVEAKGVSTDAVEVYQMPADEPCSFVGGGELIFELE